MARDNSPQVRQKNNLARHNERLRSTKDRILIVTEGSKTEPQYFNDMRKELRVSAASIAVMPSALGTSPLQVVQYARQILVHGDRNKGIERRSFEKVYAVFDRDDHKSYREALELAGSLNLSVKNDVGQLVEFQAVASIPNFELWILLHFQDVFSAYDRDKVLSLLLDAFPGYAKGSLKVYGVTRHLLQDAIGRAELLARMYSPFSDPQPYTGVVNLVKTLISSRDRADRI